MIGLGPRFESNITQLNYMAMICQNRVLLKRSQCRNICKAIACILGFTDSTRTHTCHAQCKSIKTIKWNWCTMIQIGNEIKLIDVFELLIQWTKNKLLVLEYRKAYATIVEKLNLGNRISFCDTFKNNFDWLYS